MEYIVIILIFIVNYLLWRYLFYSILLGILNLPRYFRLFVVLIFFLLIPYVTLLMIFDVFNLNQSIVVNPMVNFIMVYVAMASYRSLAN
ncbi:hypothetical protein [Sphingobacterium hungaricum]|uniref:hypothetical protein n=1 Tax=Sphingobacterium hungaricum TaxID=2082723 RepID=UPI0018CAF422|nr:hypothetical protein [Sphingobacterium hungaricum]